MSGFLSKNLYETDIIDESKLGIIDWDKEEKKGKKRNITSLSK